MRRGCCATRRQRPADEAEKRPGKAFCDALLTQSFWDGLGKKQAMLLQGVQSSSALAWADVDSVVSAMVQGTDTGDIVAFKRGEPHMRENIFLAYLDQATLSLTKAERYFPQLLDLCSDLAMASFDYVTARLVLEPPDCGTGPALQAEGDILLMQLWGQQRVSAVRSVQGLPVSAPRPQPMVKCCLRPGDALFVPSGAECQPVARGAPLAVPEGEAVEGAPAGPSLFLVLTLRSSEQAVGTSLGQYINDLLREPGALSDDSDAFFRSALTKQTRQQDAGATGKSPKEALEARMAACVEELASKVRGEGLRRHYTERMLALRQAQQAESGSKKAGSRPAPRGSVNSASLVSVASGVTCQCNPGEAHALFRRGTETLRLPIAETASYMISRLCDGKPHVVTSLPCEDLFERTCVCQILVFKGCLVLTDDEPR